MENHISDLDEYINPCFLHQQKQTSFNCCDICDICTYFHPLFFSNKPFYLKLKLYGMCCK